MPFDPDQPRDEFGKWTDTGIVNIKDAGSAIKEAASDSEKAAASYSKIVKDVNALMKAAKEAMPEIQQVAEELAEKYGARVTPPNLKGSDRILQKANDDYGGDVSQVKDAARNTIVIDPDKIDSLVNELSKMPGTVRVKRQNSADDPLGYSGTIVNYKAKNGLIGEIQVNTPAMIYAKEKKERSRVILGSQIFESMEKKYSGDGGRGHKIYDQWRDLDHKLPGNSTKIEMLEKESKTYYAKFR